VSTTTSIDETTFHFTGQREEADIGLYDYKARWYDPQLGRFIQPDIIVPDRGNPQSLNRYSYCLNNPLKLIDPSGLSPADWDTEWVKEYRDKHDGAKPTEQDWLDYQLSLRYPGTGPGGDWSTDDWEVYALVRSILGPDLLAQIGQGGSLQVDICTTVGQTVGLRGDGKHMLGVRNGKDGFMIWLQSPVPQGMGGMTIGELVMVPEGFSYESHRGVVAEEYVHVLQFRDQGVLMLIQYPIELLFKGYGDQISYEAVGWAINDIYEEHRWLPFPWEFPYLSPTENLVQSWSPSRSLRGGSGGGGGSHAPFPVF
jgi:RHS repeat-associated protein